MSRPLRLISAAARIAWNLSVLAFYVGIPIAGVWLGGWRALALLAIGLVAVALARRPSALLGLWAGWGLGK